MSSREELEALIAQQGNHVRELKKGGAAKEDIKAAVAELLKRKATLAEKFPPEKLFNREGFEDLMKRRFFYAQAFEIYGGVSGLYDYGPTGCAIMNNIKAEWRSHFVLEEGMYEISCPSMTPAKVLEASGHVERFADIMVKDMVNGDCHRADHLLQDELEKKIKDKKTTKEQKEEYEKVISLIDNYTMEELGALIKKYELVSPHTGNALSEPLEFNMMFKTEIGPTGDNPGFLRPETAQGIFLAFKRLYEFNNSRLPLGCAQIGTAYRNEISPKAGLLRVREFPLAEIEHFIDPEDKSHPKFKTVADVDVPLYSAENQMGGKPATHVKLGEALEKGIISSEVLGYFLGRIYLFLTKAGADPKKIRFRQHMSAEMAHYACDCWDAELKTSYGWIECVGCADRSCYDITQHAKASGHEIFASKRLDEPVIRDVVEVVADKKKCGPVFKKDAKLIFKHFGALSNEEAEAFEKQIAEGPVTLTLEGKELTVTPDIVEIKRRKDKVFEKKFVPSVIEPSFGLGRIVYSILEHSFQVREGDEHRQWLALAPVLAPVKCSLLPLMDNEAFVPVLDNLASQLTAAGVSYRRDDSSATIGKRYARTDEIGIPFGITVDYTSLEAHTVTLRERNSMKQIRLPIDHVAGLVSRLCSHKGTWEEAVKEYGGEIQQATDEKKVKE